MKYLKSINEVKITHKDIYKKGSYNTVYPFLLDDDKVIKIGKDAVEHAKIFLEFPQYCPKVFKLSDNYVILEKLNTEKATYDIEEFIDKDRGYIHNWGLNIFVNDIKFNNLLNLITTEYGKKLLLRIREIVININMTDIHSRNFGYDKYNILKALDI